MENNKKNNNEFYSVDVRHILKSLWRRLWVILLSALLSAAVGFSLASFIITPSYSSSVLLYVSNSTSAEDVDTKISSSDISASQSLVLTYAELIKSRRVLEGAIEQGELKYTYEQLYDMVESSSLNETEMMALTVTSADADEASYIANLIAAILPEISADTIDGAVIEVVDLAVPAQKRSSPSIGKYTVVGVLIGMLLSSLVIVIITALDERIYDAAVTVQAYNYPLLASFAKPNKKKLSDDEWQYRLLCANAEFALGDFSGCAIVGITSSREGEGKTDVAIGLAQMLAQKGNRVLLADGNAFSPSVAKKLGACADIGLAELLLGASADIEDMRSSVNTNLYVMTSGKELSRALQSMSFGKIFDEYRNIFDYIIVDLSCAEPAAELMSVIDNAVFVLRQNYVTKNEFDAAIRQLRLSKTNILGCVVTDA